MVFELPPCHILTILGVILQGNTEVLNFTNIYKLMTRKGIKL